MSYHIIIWSVCFGLILGHLNQKRELDIVEGKIKEMEKNLEQYKQEEIDIKQRATELLVKKSTKADDNKQLITQLEKMNEAMDAIVTAVKQRKGRSGPRRDAAVTEVQRMEKKVKETDKFIDSLKKLSNVQLEKVADNIARVNRSAFIKVNANGAVLYGGVGSKCIDTSGECVTPNSECRVGKCQCSLGLSYNLGTQSCVASCTEYGSTYQSVPLWIIRGFNDRVLNGTTLVACAETCAHETSFVCRSFDWFPHFRTCYLSAQVKTGAGDAWEYNSAGYHFQRDCLV